MVLAWINAFGCLPHSVYSKLQACGMLDVAIHHLSSVCSTNRYD